MLVATPNMTHDSFMLINWFANINVRLALSPSIAGSMNALLLGGYSNRTANIFKRLLESFIACWLQNCIACLVYGVSFIYCILK